MGQAVNAGNMKDAKDTILMFVILTCLLAYGALVNIKTASAEVLTTVKIGIVTADFLSAEENLILSAYKQVLHEEGFPYQIVSHHKIAGMSPWEVSSEFTLLVLPEKVNAILPAETAMVINSYVRESGGKILLCFDPAIKNTDGSQYPDPLLGDLAGVHHNLSGYNGGTAAYSGYCYFTTADTGREWGITPGRLTADNALGSYKYEKLKFEHVVARNVDANIIAFDHHEGAIIPVITEKFYKDGGVAVYVNLPLGGHKLKSDDLVLRSVLRTFFIRYARVPRLVNSPAGRGGIVFNLHVCSGAYFRSLLVMKAEGLLTKELPYSIHVTAGPDTYYPGDGTGFFADSKYKGRAFLRLLNEFGEIGSHGGWIHNYFAYNLKYIPTRRALNLLDWNFQALESGTGKAVVEYSAPGGYHPEWLNQHLAEQGVIAYYWPGDIGSSPSRCLPSRENNTGQMWAFPVTAYRKYASFEEMENGGVPIEEVAGWLEDLFDFCAGERVVRMIYTHPPETRYGFKALRHFVQFALSGQRKDKVRVASMGSFADFLNRHEKTRWQVTRQSDLKHIVELGNSQGLRGITVALYVGDGSNVIISGGDAKSVLEDGWLYLSVNSDHQFKRYEVINYKS